MSTEKPKQVPKGIKRLSGPTVIRYSEATRFLWGDEKSHQVSDWIYGGGSKISSFMYSLRPGECFRASEIWKPQYDQHRFYYVYQGMLAVHDPERGEVAVANEGEAVFWKGLKWHFGYNFGQKEALIFDVWAPGGTPVDIDEVALSAEKPDLQDVVNGRYDLLGKWPAAQKEVGEQLIRDGAMVTLRRSDCLHMIVGQENQTLVSLFVSTEEVTTGLINLLPGKMSEGEMHPGDEALMVTQGRLNVYLPDTYDWFEVHPLDSMFIPEGVRHQYCNMTHEPVELFFAVAPRYR